MLTVIFASYNGQHTLPTMLEAMCELTPPDEGWELIAVNNASTDETSRILASYADRLPMRVLDEPKRGKNAALNRGLNERLGELVVLTDDDVVPKNDWLCQLAKSAHEHGEWDVLGGRIVPRWPWTPPSWLIESVPTRIIYAISADMPEGDVHPGRVWGPSMAVRRRVFEAGHRFDESVGPAAGNYRMGSETEFTTRLAGLGYKCGHVPQAEVEHLIRPHQMDPDWIAQRGYRFGRDMYWKENSPLLNAGRPVEEKKVPQLFGLPRWYYSAFIMSGLSVIRWKVGENPGNSLKARWDFHYWRGYFYEKLKSDRPA